MNFSLSLVVAMALFIMATARFIPYEPAKVGAPFPVDPEDPNVLVAADFAVADSYDLDATSYTVLSATKQIVSGTLYDLTVAVTETSDGYCTVFNYVVHEVADQASTVPYELKSTTELTDQQC
jgi:Cystatin domain